MVYKIDGTDLILTRIDTYNKLFNRKREHASNDYERDDGTRLVL